MPNDSSSQPTQPLTGQPMRPEGGCSLAGPNGTRIPIEEPHSYSFRKGANTIFVRTCDLCGDIDWDALHEATVERVAIEVSRLRAENTALAAKITEVRELRRTWLQNADVVRGKADSIPGLTEVERAELRQGAVELEHCARQVGFALGPTPEEEPDFVVKDLDRRLHVDDTERSALGLDQDGGQANG